VLYIFDFSIIIIVIIKIAVASFKSSPSIFVGRPNRLYVFMCFSLEDYFVIVPAVYFDHFVRSLRSKE